MGLLMKRKPTEMELRVAKAMRNRAGKAVSNLANLNSVLVGSLGDAWPFLAMAAIRAMRKPTKKMILAGKDKYEEFKDSTRDYDFVHSGHEQATYAAMIDAASPE